MNRMTISGPSSRVQIIASGLRRKAELNGWIAGEAFRVFEANFVQLSATNRNQFGVRGGFWNRMLSGTKAMATEEAAIIRMPREVRLRHLGGTVVPKKGKYLAIPMRAEAYGKSPRDFDDLHVIKARSGALFLVRNARSVVRKRRDRNGVQRIVPGANEGAYQEAGLALYVLVSSATIKPNPAVLPPKAEIQAAVKRGADGFMKTLTKK